MQYPQILWAAIRKRNQGQVVVTSKVTWPVAFPEIICNSTVQDLSQPSIYAFVPGAVHPGQGQYFSGPLQCFLTLYRTGGIHRCYRGFWIQAMRDLPVSGTYFCTYNLLYAQMMHNNLTDRHGIFANLMAGGIAGVISWSIIVPLDVVKSQIQADYMGFMYQNPLASARAVYIQSGIRGFYSGWLMICIRAFPVNATTFLIYAKSVSLLNDLW